MLDFMFWPSATHRIGWCLEPSYSYGFGREHEQSLGVGAGLLIAIPKARRVTTNGTHLKPNKAANASPDE